MKGSFHLFVSGRYLLAAPRKGSTFALAQRGGTAAGRSEAAAPAQLLWDPQGGGAEQGGRSFRQKRAEEERGRDADGFTDADVIRLEGCVRPTAALC